MNKIFKESVTVNNALAFAKYEVCKIALETRLSDLRKKRTQLLERSPKNVEMLLQINMDEQNDVKNALAENEKSCTIEMDEDYAEVVHTMKVAGNNRDNIIRLLRLVACVGDIDSKRFYNTSLSAFTNDELVLLHNTLIRLTDDNVSVINEHMFYAPIADFIRSNFSVPFETCYNNKFRAKCNTHALKRVIHTFVRGYKNVFSDKNELIRVDINTSIKLITKGRNKGTVKAEPFIREVAGVVEYLAFK